jgi:hypothetical protein
MTDENMEGWKRSRTPAPEATVDGELMVPSVTSISQTPFADQWLSDEDIRTYHRIDFMPRPLKCPTSVFNLWAGFACEKEPPATEYDRELMNEWVLPFIKEIICGGIETSNT